MTFAEGAAIASGLAIGYWLIAVFMPGMREDRDAPYIGDGLPPGAERGELPEDWNAPRPPWHVVLGVAADANREAIDDAYRRALDLYDPDRVAHLGDDIRARAEAKTRRVHAAYAEATRATTLPM